MGIKLNAANGGGSVALDVPATVNSDLAVTVPAMAGELACKDTSGNLRVPSTGKYVLTEGTTDAFSVSTNGANGYLSIKDEFNNSERVRITNTGNVGIGTSNPDATTHIEATNASLLLSNIGRSQYFRIQNNETDDALTFNANDANERLRIHSNGAVSKPSQPGFYARRTTSGDGRPTGNITEWTISGTGSYNEGGHFKTTGTDVGLFVAPVTGVYYFAACPGYKQTANNLQWYFHINNTLVSEPVRIIDSGDDLESHSTFTGTCTIHLTAGDKFGINIGHSHHANTTFNFFCGHFLG